MRPERQVSESSEEEARGDLISSSHNFVSSNCFKFSDEQFFVGDNPGQARWKGGHDRDSELLEVNNVVVSGI